MVCLEIDFAVCPCLLRPVGRGKKESAFQEVRNLRSTRPVLDSSRAKKVVRDAFARYGIGKAEGKHINVVQSVDLSSDGDGGSARYFARVRFAGPDAMHVVESMARVLHELEHEKEDSAMFRDTIDDKGTQLVVLVECHGHPRAVEPIVVPPEDDE